MDYKQFYFRELCREIVYDRVIGKKFNDLLVKTEVYLDEQEWAAANRLLEASERLDHLASSSMYSVH